MSERSGKLRCAIYTRESSEEDLDQAFNSLDAQREACEAYITSQAGSGGNFSRIASTMAASPADRWNARRCNACSTRFA